MLAIKSILAPTDFSQHAEKALSYACDLAEHFGATLHLLHVLPDVVPVGPDPMLVPSFPPEYYTESEAHSQEALAHVLELLSCRAPAVETAVRWGDAVDGIVAYAADRSIDLIVIATHGRTGLSHVLLGSVAERIVREAPCPVLTIRSA
ncbi:MAG: universal stress protein [Isosphaeraceae bacterium]|nr:universal stress protein [Isosphaeraceae bacterium]